RYVIVHPFSHLPCFRGRFYLKMRSPIRCLMCPLKLQQIMINWDSLPRLLRNLARRKDYELILPRMLLTTAGGNDYELIFTPDAIIHCTNERLRVNHNNHLLNQARNCYNTDYS